MFKYIWVIPFIINLLIFATGVAVYSMTLQWINQLEISNCKCSEDYKRDFIKYFLYFYLIFLALNIIAFIISIIYGVYTAFAPAFKVNKYVAMIGNFIQGIWQFIEFLTPYLFIVNVVFSIMYITKLKDFHKTLSCECSEDVRREIYYYWNLISAGIIGLSLLLAFIWFIIIYIKSDRMTVTVLNKNIVIKGIKK